MKVSLFILKNIYYKENVLYNKNLLYRQIKMLIRIYYIVCQISFLRNNISDLLLYILSTKRNAIFFSFSFFRVNIKYFQNLKFSKDLLFI